ncbi:MBL fold hydrolase [Spirochaetia bacterium]|nr:MBL fold hydrolase [Spirochaetia bacterium]
MNDIKNLVVGPLDTNCWIATAGDDSLQINGKTAASVIDPGGDAQTIINVLEHDKLYPAFILITHGHFDHIAALGELADFYSSYKPVIAIAEGDAALIGNSAFDEHRRSLAYIGAEYLIEGNGPYACLKNLPEATRILHEGDKIANFTVIELPGHSEGSIGFYDEKTKTIFSGDTLFAGGIGRTDLSGSDSEKMTASLGRLFSMDKNITVYPGHGETTTIGQEIKWQWQF